MFSTIKTQRKNVADFVLKNLRNFNYIFILIYIITSPYKVDTKNDVKFWVDLCLVAKLKYKMI